ncbi:hypothetical protein MTR67_003129, partial [Solanum verrucosum]
WIEEQSKDTNLQKGTKRAERRKKRDVLSLEGESQAGERKEQLEDHRVVPRCSIKSPKVIDLEDSEGQCKKAMEWTKKAYHQVDRQARLTTPNDPSQHIFGDYKYIFEHLI